ncbi:MAG: aldo/keto reductase [Phycisphaeraceae bacterium]
MTTTPTTHDTLTAPMPTRQLRGLDWQASLLTLGGVKWDSVITETQAIELIHRAIELGVNTFDTASNYAKGESERRLGKALLGHRDNVFIATKSSKRDYDGARRDIEQSLNSLQTDTIDLFFIHSLEDDNDLKKALDPQGVLKAIDEFKAAGHIRNVGVSGHWFKHNMIHAINDYPFQAVLLPIGLFNEAYNYSFPAEVIPVARNKDLAVLGMKVLAAGRAKHVADITPYIRFAINQDVDTAVIGADSIQQLEQTIRIIKSKPVPLPPEETKALFDEARQVTQSFDPGEFSWVSHYKQ